jgi:hypothetical protein
MRFCKIAGMILTTSSLIIPALTVTSIAPAFAATGSTPAASRTNASSPTFDECFQLAWVRDVHVELGELEAFNEYCMANQVPFDSRYAADSVRRGSH